MAYSALIDDLEKQFAENPRRVFARLANEYRKAGDLERAIAYCRAHIPTAPSYISGYIVLGQALYESQRFEEARQAFETALNLDPENLIALRQLGDISRQNGDNESARAWYTRLLEVDPQNEEIVAQLSSITPQPRTDSGGWWPSDNAIGWHGVMQASPQTSGSDTSSPLPIEPLPEAHAEPVAALPSDDAVLGHGDGVAEHEPLDQYMNDSELFSPETYLSSAEAPAMPFDGAIDGADVRPIDELAPDEHSTTEAAASSASEFAATDMAVFSRGAEEFAALEDAQPAASASAPESAEQPAVAPMYDPLVGRQIDFDAAPDTSSPAFVTETMADLYLQQGFTGEALSIYRQLVEQNPSDEVLRKRLAEIEELASPSGASAADRSARDGDGTPESVRRTNVRQLFGGLATRRAPKSTSGNGASSNGAPREGGLFIGASSSPSDEQAARRLAGAFSSDYREPAGEQDELGLLFGDSVEIKAPSGAESAAHDARDVSFDDFFATGRAKSAGDEQAHLGGARETTASDSSASSQSDIDTFHAWLGGLKQ